MKQLPLFLMCLGLGLPQLSAQGENPEPGHEYSEAHKFVFFSVLEGCYRDGLTNKQIDLIIPPIERSDFRDHSVNMVVTCPLCGPAFDAFNMYAEHKRFNSQPKKITSYTTFGPGLSKEVKIELAKPGKPCRTALQGLIKKWIEERINKHRLTKEETKALREELDRMRKEGEDALKRFKEGKHGESLQKTYLQWGDECPVCSGASPMGRVLKVPGLELPK